jgi:hypothetical protein
MEKVEVRARVLVIILDKLQVENGYGDWHNIVEKKPLQSL